MFAWPKIKAPPGAKFDHEKTLMSLSSRVFRGAQAQAGALPVPPSGTPPPWGTAAVKDCCGFRAEWLRVLRIALGFRPAGGHHEPIRFAADRHRPHRPGPGEPDDDLSDLKDSQGKPSAG